MKKALFILSIIIVLLSSCAGGRSDRAHESGDTLQLKYAKNLTIVKYKDYTVATLANPWKKGKTLHTYILVPLNEKMPDNLPEGTVIRTPLRHVVVFTTVHCSLITSLGKQECISGVADLKYIKIPWIQQQCRKGKIADCGEGLSPMIEKIIDMHPDAIFLSPFENSGGYGKLEEINIPLVECAEYMETSPLGRAEWMKFYGMLLGIEQRSDSLFNAVDSSYNALRQVAKRSSIHQSVLMDKNTGSVWYVPGGESTIGQLIADAQGKYPYANDKHSGSIPLPFEAVLEKAGNADVWMFRHDGNGQMTYQSLLAENHGYGEIKAYKTHQAYGCNVDKSLFYEESPFHPDYLLADFIHILHPDIKGLPPLRYYYKLK
jgi:iron complex transport system substrate-binding protein